MKRQTYLKVFYFIKPFVPRSLQIFIRRVIALIIRNRSASIWPILHQAGEKPANWSGWPEGRDFALVLRHDVESSYGLERIDKLMAMEKEFGLRSSFNFSPERYTVPHQLIGHVKADGFEVGLHGLKHDGKLYASSRIFEQRLPGINRYLKEWEIDGFVSPSSHHNMEWISRMNIFYDSSTFDTDPFEPQNDSVGRIFPFIYTSEENKHSYVELPYTLPQDLTLFIILNEKNIDVWKKKVDWIARQGGMVLLNTHPDYMNFNGSENSRCRYPSDFYRDFLEYITTHYKDRYINLKPREAAQFFRDNNG